MDDMKKLVEKYKQELMEYKKAAAPEPGELKFPEMLEEQPAAQPVSEDAAAEPEATESGQPVYEPEFISKEIIVQEDIIEYEEAPAEKRPQIIGYTSGDNAEEAERAIEHILSEERVPPPADDMDASDELFAAELSQEDIPSPSERENGEHLAIVPPPDLGLGSAMESGADDGKCCDGKEESRGGKHKAPPEDDGIRLPGIDGLFDTPVSGHDSDEQLGKRSFEDESVKPNPRDDIKPLVTQSRPGHEMTEPEYANIEEFNKANQRRGTLRFRIYTARGAFPVKNATCTITKQIGGETHTFYTLRTDMSGQSAVVSLPAPPASLSQDPDNTVQPYALYDVLIKADGYADIVVEKLPIFEGVLSIQRASMLPLAEAGESETITADEPDLNGGK